ncbi:hypothetical protein [Streptomyces sp. NPDC008240]|uniref:hypothetical protein n=1 Tax=Streptomyces sp. NPDC008240 TaxID=3364822 RepID=UPI0036E58C3D
MHPVSLLGGGGMADTGLFCRTYGSGAARADGLMPCSRTAGMTMTSTRRLVRALGITPVIAERGEDHGSGLDVFRWVVERTISSLFGTTSR